MRGHTPDDLWHLVLDAMGEGVIVSDARGNLVLVNRAAEQLLGLETSDVAPGEWMRRYGIYLPDGTTRLAPERFPLVRALEGELVGPEELFVRSPRIPAGARLTCSARPVRDAGGAIRGAVVVFRDVTALRLLEREREALLAGACRLDAALGAIAVHAGFLARAGEVPPSARDSAQEVLTTTLTARRDLGALLAGPSAEDRERREPREPREPHAPA